MVVSIVAHPSDHHRELPAAPAGPAGPSPTAATASSPQPSSCSAQRPRQSGRGCSPTSRAPFRNSASKAFPPGRCPRLSEPDGVNLHGLQRRLGHGYRIFALASDGEHRKLGIVLPDGAMLSANILPDRPRPPFWGGPWMMTLLFAVISVTLLGLWAARALTAPLSSFAKAAESFSLNGAAAPLPERGPEEIRSVARALNRMRERITAPDRRPHQDAGRDQPRSAHADHADAAALRIHRGRRPIAAACSRDLDQMRSMLESVLSFLRNDRRLEAMTLVDVASTLQLITDQFADIGHKVAYDGPAHAMATVRPDDLHRAVTNLVENAVRFGAEVAIRLRVSAGRR